MSSIKIEKKKKILYICNLSMLCSRDQKWKEVHEK